MRKLVFIFTLVVTASCSKDFVVTDLDTGPKKTFLGEIEYVKNFGGSGEDTAQAIIVTNDGGFAVFGFSNSTDGDLAGKTLAVNDYWLLKFDAESNLQWSKTYGGSKDDRGQSLVQTNDGGYALTGYAESSDGDASSNQGFHDNWIVKLDAQGTLQWEKSFGFSGHDHSYDILQTTDNGLFFAGFLDITSARADGNTEKGNTLTRHGVGEFWGSKLDKNGNLQWRSYFGGTNNDRAHAVVQADDGGFVMAGFTESNDFDVNNSRGSYDFWVVKLDDKGNLKWQSPFGGTGIERAQDIAKTDDGGYVISGNTFSTDGDITKNHGESDIWLIKVASDGKMVWERTFGGSGFDDAQSVSLSADGGFIIAGNSKSNDADANANAGENDIWVIKTDENGNMVWQKSFGGTGLDFGFDALETADGGIILVGETSSTDFLDLHNMGKSDAVIIKIR
ncbi:MAG: hypothetical protein ACFCUL_07235 [Flavobacteriaceae bacterium]